MQCRLYRRALPDVRDGLVSSPARSFAMHELGNGYNRAYKSARIVGDVIGKYHPQYDQAVYDTLVRMAQPFSMITHAHRRTGLRKYRWRRSRGNALHRSSHGKARL